MTKTDLTDVPAVEAADLAAAMQSLLEAGRGLVLHRGLEDADLDIVQSLIKSRFNGEPQRALAVFLRFRHLAEVFAARRLKAMMTHRGYAIMAPAIAVAASLRLNANRGFNPQAFVMSLADALPGNVVAMPARRAAPVAAKTLPLAA
jgi:hypothetical protein